MPNPFTPTFGVTPPLLVGREEEIATFTEAIAPSLATDVARGHPSTCSSSGTTPGRGTSCDGMSSTRQVLWSYVQ